MRVCWVTRASTADFVCFRSLLLELEVDTPTCSSPHCWSTYEQTANTSAELPITLPPRRPCSFHFLLLHDAGENHQASDLDWTSHNFLKPSVAKITRRWFDLLHFLLIRRCTSSAHMTEIVSVTSRGFNVVLSGHHCVSNWFSLGSYNAAAMRVAACQEKVAAASAPRSLFNVEDRFVLFFLLKSNQPLLARRKD